MNQDLIIGVLKQAMLTEAMMIAPLLITGLTVGIVVGALQAATQVNEPTLPFVVKLIAVGTVGAFILPWEIDRLVMLFHMIGAQIAQLVVH